MLRETTLVSGLVHPVWWVLHILFHSSCGEHHCSQCSCDICIRTAVVLAVFTFGRYQNVVPLWGSVNLLEWSMRLWAQVGGPCTNLYGEHEGTLTEHPGFIFVVETAGERSSANPGLLIAAVGNWSGAVLGIVANVWKGLVEALDTVTIACKFVPWPAGARVSSCQHICQWLIESRRGARCTCNLGIFFGVRLTGRIIIMFHLRVPSTLHHWLHILSTNWVALQEFNQWFHETMDFHRETSCSRRLLNPGVGLDDPLWICFVPS